MRYREGEETPVIPDEPGDIDADDALQGFGVGAAGRLYRTPAKFTGR
jgi:hypothetical protein